MTPAPTIPETTTPVPAYAAGPGVPGPALLAATAHGWTLARDEAANVVCTSPDGLARLEFGPETERYHRDRDMLWLAAYGPTGPGGSGAWGAVFGDQTPAEVIGRFINALAHPDAVAVRAGRAHTPVYTAGAGDPQPVFTVLEEAGWSALHEADLTAYTSPDDLARVGYHTGADVHGFDPAQRGPNWTVGYSAMHEDRRNWRACLSHQTPVEAVAALAAALTDPAGLHPDRD
jgi:hypothetical protein